MSPDRPRNRSTFLLRLPKSLSDAAKQIAGEEGVSLNQFISLALAEKIVRVEQSATRTATHRTDKESGPRPIRPAD